MSHKWWKSMAVWGSLVDKVFLSLYMSKCMEHGKLNHLLFHDIQYKWIHISQGLGSQNSDYSNRNFLPTIQIPFWWICILSFILRCRREKWWPASVFSPKEQSLGCSHQPSPSWKTPERTTRPRMDETGVWKKRDEAKQVRRIWTAPPVQVNTEPQASHLTIMCSEKKWRFQNFLLSKLQRRERYLTQNKKASVNRHRERFEPRSHFKSRLSLTVRVNVFLNVNRHITLISGKLVHLTLTSKLNIARTKFSNLIGHQMSCSHQE